MSGFGGDQRFVVEYLSQEVLASLDDETRSFLQGTSVLGQFTAELCDAVLERTDSASMLAGLERSNLFIRRLERGGWFRAHALFAEFAVAQLAAQKPGAAARIHQRAAVWLLSHGLPVEAVEHAAAAGDDERVARMLAEYHMPLIRSGLTRTILRWVRTLPDESLLEHPELAVAAAAAAMMPGQGTIEHRRYLQIVERAQAERPERVTPYVEAFALVERAITIDGGVAQAVENGRRAVELARAGLDELLTGALAGYALALYFADNLDETWKVALSVIEHPSIERRPPSHVLARTTLALVAIERGWLESARGHAEKAKAVVGRIGTSRSWLGANASAALGAVLASEGQLAEAEHELAYAEHYFRDEIATVHHAWLLLLLARVRTQRGRLDQADATLQAARKALEELADGGRLPSLADDVEHELGTATARAGSGEMLERPSKAELAVLQLLAGDLSTREIGEHLFVSPNTIRSHTRALYRKLGANSRSDAVARATALGLLGKPTPVVRVHLSESGRPPARRGADGVTSKRAPSRRSFRPCSGVDDRTARRDKEILMPEVTETPVLDLLASMTADSVEASSLDPEKVMLVRIAALVAMDAPPVSYLYNLGTAADFDVDADDVRGILAAIAPIVGTARVASATSKIVHALGIAIDLAELEADEAQEA